MLQVTQSVSWHGKDGSMTTIKTPPYSTLREARLAAIESAKHFGYTAPRWWQWWRWGDLDYERLPIGEPVLATPTPAAGEGEQGKDAGHE